MILRFSLPDTFIPKSQRLEQIKDNYDEMLSSSNDLIGERISFWLEPDKDIDLIKAFENDYECIGFVQPNQVHFEGNTFTTDFLIMTHRAINTNYHSHVYQLYVNLYKEYHNHLTGSSPDEPVDYNDYRFYLFTELFFNITYIETDKGIIHGDGLNTMDYLCKYHRELTFKNVMLGDCQVAASFASQSNHNLIGRTNDTFTPIKYYKVNDEDDHFLVEFYDRD